jgi:hypothetical protein
MAASSSSSSSSASASQLHPPTLPEIGHPESYYARLVHKADRENSPHAREAAKVGQYITLGIDPYLSWEQKLRYFQHALRRHCQPPKVVSDPVWMFYNTLADLVRQYCGAEALRLASAEDDRLAAAIQLGGATREEIAQDAENFFAALTGFGESCPEHFNEVDWAQLKMIRNQWV